MTLAPGTRLGGYEIEAPLGAGGMGEVYRAHDSQLGRTVAIKALPESFAQEADRLARFEREARLLAALSHPNIAGIHGVVEAGGHRYLALEFVDGESLLQRLARGALPVDEALDVGAQVAAALEAAHEAGIVHRDLKPGNVMLRGDGVVKVLDFGLARGPAGAASGADVTQSPTVTSPATLPGVVLGTAAYMSPEQAKGRPVDRRADVWAWGCLLYECLSGRRAFAGEDVSDTLAAILRGEPDWSALPAATPPGVVALLRRCLARDPRDRQRDLGDARLALLEARAAGPPPAAVRAAPAAARALPWLVATALAVVATALWLRRPAPEPPLDLVLPIPDSGVGGFPGQFAISPDGRAMACAALDSSGDSQIWVRRLDRLDAVHIAPGDMPFWSPDSRTLGFFDDGKLRRAPADGGNVVDVCDAPDPRGGTWSPTGEIVFAPTGQGPLARVNAEGGTPRPATRLDAAHGDHGHRFPQFLPDGRHFLYLSMQPAASLPTYVASLDDPAGRPLARGEVVCTFAPPHWLLTLRGTGLVAQRVDLRSWRVLGDPVDLRVTPEAEGPWALAPVASATADRLLYPQSDARTSRAEWWDANGSPRSGVDLRDSGFEAPVLSPDGNTLCLLENAGSSGSLWRVDLASGSRSRIGRPGAAITVGRWSRDGSRLAFTQLTPGGQTVVVKDQAGLGAERVVYRTPKLFTVLNDWAPDGRHLLMSQRGTASRNDLEILDTVTGQVTPYLETPAEEGYAAISPDGRWVAYETDESGRNQLVVNSYPHPGLAHPVSTAGTLAFPDACGWWVNGGHDLVFLSATAVVMRAHVRSLAPPAFDAPVRLFRPPIVWGGLWPSADGRRFLLVLPNGDAPVPGQVLVTHWTDGLGR